MATDRVGKEICTPSDYPSQNSRSQQALLFRTTAAAMQSVAKPTVVMPPAAAKATPAVAPPMALILRRAALSAVLLSGLSLATVDKASAKVAIPSQESTPGNKGGLSAASASAYTLEGIKKRGLSGAQRKKLLAAVQRLPLPAVK